MGKGRHSKTHRATAGDVMVKIIVFIMLIAAMYLTFTFSSSPKIKYWRDAWIETAMTTAEHQWLATKFFPKSVIDKAMSGKVMKTQADDIFKISKDNSELIDTYSKYNKGDTDIAGFKVYDVDIKNNIAVSIVTGDGFVGKAVIAFNPSKVRIVHTQSPGEIGENILTILRKNNAIAGMNASGFYDPNGVGSGGAIVGKSRASGKDWGEYSSEFDTIGFTRDNRLVVGERVNWDKDNIRDACQFNPVLVKNGVKNVEGTAGWGIQPRTAIGQREDGVVVMIVVDGRKPGYSLGINMEQLADLFIKYGCVNAAACDGGSSSIMGYKGEIITRCSSPQDGGRYLPNAIIVDKG